MDVNKEKKVEELLRAERGVELSPDFKRNIMAEIMRLPSPELTAPPSGSRDWIYVLKLMTPGQTVAFALMALAVAVLLLPGTGDLLAAWDWEFSDIELTVSIGEEVVSASVMSLIAVGIGAVFMTGIGIYSSQSKLIGT